MNSTNSLPPLRQRKSINIEIDETEVPAFNEMLSEFFNGTRYQAIIERKQVDREAQIDSLKYLYKLTQRHPGTGQASIIARFLASLYNGYRFRFDLTDFRALDTELFKHCLNVLWLEHQPVKEVHRYFDNGKALWESMIQDYGLEEDKDLNDGVNRQQAA